MHFKDRKIKHIEFPQLGHALFHWILNTKHIDDVSSYSSAQKFVSISDSQFPASLIQTTCEKQMIFII